MKKYIAVLLTLTLMLGLGAVTVQAAGNYPSTDADFGVTIDILEDGSVNIGANADAINSAVSSVASGFNANWIYIAIYDSNPNFNADSDMTGAGQPYTEVLAGDTAAGRVDGSAFKYNIKSGALDKDDPTIPLRKAKLIMYTSVPATAQTGFGITPALPSPIKPKAIIPAIRVIGALLLKFRKTAALL